MSVRARDIAHALTILVSGTPVCKKSLGALRADGIGNAFAGSKQDKGEV